MNYDAITKYIESLPWWRRWVGVYWNYFWVTVWSSKNLEITLGIGESFRATTNKVFSVKEYKFLCFWAYVTRPTVGFINGSIKGE